MDMLLRPFCVFAAFACSFCVAQTPASTSPTPDQTPTLSLNANLVNLPVVVRDKKGAIVTNLTKTDFALSVDGHVQTIRYFDRDQNLPLTLGLLVDVSQSQRTVLDEEETASSAFLDTMLTPSDRAADRAFVLQFAREVELLQDLTSSRPKLQAAMKQLGTENPHQRSNDDSNSSDSSGNGSDHRHGGTALYDAVYLSSNELLKKQQGRKAIVILSDGGDRNSKETLNEAIEAAQRADTIIYAIYFKSEEPQHNNNNSGGGRFPGGGGGGYPGGGSGYPGGGGGYPGGGGRNGGGNRGGGQPTENRVDGKKILQQMADETGGRLFEGKKGKIQDIYSQIAEELRSQYRLGYTPDTAITSDGYHQIDLKIPAQKNLKVQTRDGYYTGK